MQPAILHVLVGPGGGAWSVVKALASEQRNDYFVSIGLVSGPNHRNIGRIVDEARHVSDLVLTHQFPSKRRFASALSRQPIEEWQGQVRSASGSTPVVHFHNGVASAVALARIKLKGTAVPSVATIHGLPPVDHPNSPNWKPWRTYVHSLLTKYVVNSGTKMVAVSLGTKQQLERYYRLRGCASRIQVIPNGIAKPEVLASALTRRSKLVIGYVGALSPDKNWRAVCEASRVLRASGLENQVVVCGAGPDQHLATALVQEDPFVDYLGPVSNAAGRVIAHLDVLCLPSLTEGLPIVLLEALALGVPVVATAVGGIPEVVIPRRTGCLIGSAEVELLADGIKEVAAWNIAEVRKNCEEQFSKRFGSRLMKTRYDRVYESAVCGGPQSLWSTSVAARI